MKEIFDIQKIILSEFDPEKVIFDSEEVFIGCDYGDLPDTAVEVKIVIKEGEIYIIDEKVRPIRTNEKMPYVWIVKDDKIEFNKTL